MFARHTRAGMGFDLAGIGDSDLRGVRVDEQQVDDIAELVRKFRLRRRTVQIQRPVMDGLGRITAGAQAHLLQGVIGGRAVSVTCRMFDPQSHGQALNR